jgi:hypothetical protein
LTAPVEYSLIPLGKDQHDLQDFVFLDSCSFA